MISIVLSRRGSVLALVGSIALIVGSPSVAVASPDDLQYACVGDVAGAAQDPVVLVHGTWTTSAEDFGAITEPWLTANGRPYCTVELPGRGTADMQVSARLVEDAVLRTAQTRGGKVDLIGHSQGGTLGAYVAKTVPAVAAVLDDYIGLAPVSNGLVRPDPLCAALGGCAAPVWQFAEGSAFMTALTSAPLPAGPSFTTVASVFDELVRPAPAASAIPGASNVVIQQLCPGRYVGHLLIQNDATALAVAADALDHDGPADPARVGASGCGRLVPEGTDPLAPIRAAPAAVGGFLSSPFQSENLPAEPPYTGR